MKCCETYPWRAPLHVGEYQPHARILVSSQYAYAIILHLRTCSRLFICLTCAHLCYLIWICIVCVFTQQLDGVQLQRLTPSRIFSKRWIQDSYVSGLLYGYYFSLFFCLTIAHLRSLVQYLQYMYEVLWNVPIACSPARWLVPTPRTYLSIAHVCVCYSFALMYVQLAFNLLDLCSFLFLLVQYLIIGMKCCETFPWRSPLHAGEYPPCARIWVSITCVYVIHLRWRTCSHLFICLTCV
jgi:hypothetical protein